MYEIGIHTQDEYFSLPNYYIDMERKTLHVFLWKIKVGSICSCTRKFSSSSCAGDSGKESGRMKAECYVQGVGIKIAWNEGRYAYDRD